MLYGWTNLLGQLDACCLKLTLLLQCSQPPGLLHLALAVLPFGLFTPLCVYVCVKACDMAFLAKIAYNNNKKPSKATHLIGMANLFSKPLYMHEHLAQLITC